MAELALAGYSAAAESIRILSDIIKIAAQAKRLKKECEEIRSIALLLSQIIQQKPRALDGSQVEPKLRNALEETIKCVSDCQESRINRAWEVLWRHRLPAMTKKLLVWVTYFTTEISVIAREDILKLLEQDYQHSQRDEGYFAEIMGKLKILEDLKKNMNGVAAGSLQLDFKEGDPRIVIDGESEDELLGALQVPGAQSVRIVGDPVNETLMRYGEKGPRHVAIYSQLSARTRVHPFYGIAQYDGKRWAVFQDLRSSPCLADALSLERLDNILARVKIAFEVAATFSYLHSVEILMKRLSDRTVLLVTEDGRLVPYLTQVEHARLFKESTSGGKYDVRYQAPEVPESGHNMQTDIWSLGVLIWQCVSRDPPFNEANMVTEDEKAQDIALLIKDGKLPWQVGQSDDMILVQVSQIVRDCCNLDARKRPPADKVEHYLLEILQGASTHIGPPHYIDDEFHGLILKLIDAAAGAHGKYPRRLLQDDEASRLRTLAENGDPTGAFLLGSAIWHELAKPTAEDYGHVQVLTVAGKDPMTENKCRAAITHLEFALQGGVKKAAEVLCQAYRELALLCNEQAQQHIKLNGLRRAKSST